MDGNNVEVKEGDKIGSRRMDMVHSYRFTYLG